jgi:stage V sporulation protein D (sporulation-specific penicillin-binding protein)
MYMAKAPVKITKKFTSKMQANLLLVFCIIALCMIGLMGRLVYIIQVKGDRYAKQVLSRETYISSILPYKRGDILDRSGTVLARSELHYKLVIDPKRLLDYKDYIPPTMEALRDAFGIDNESFQKILEERPESRYVILQKNLGYDIVEAFKERMKEDDSIVGVWFEEEYVRSYPYNTLACDVIGFTSADNTGYFGIEEYYNDELNGTNGREYGYFNAELNIERIVKKAVNGNSIVSTIDINAQRIIQKHINRFNTEFGSKQDGDGLGVAVLVMNPNNGEIIAMASKQEYDLNSPRNLSGIYSEAELSAMTEEQKMDALNLLWRNDVISFGFEPGSTFKPVTMAIGFEESIIKDGDTFYCDGFEKIPGREKPIKCSKKTGHGLLTLEEVLMKSCNDGLMQMVAMEGKENFYRYLMNFGFGKKTGIDLPGEGYGIVKSLEDLKPVDLAACSFGQTNTSTMLQMAAAYSSLVNGGYYYQPHIVKKIVNESGATVREYDKLLVRQTVSEKTSELLQQYLYRTVEAGTASGAKVEGYSIGGKTGTAEKLPRGENRYIVSFLGQVPAVNPEIVIYVVIDEPQNVEEQVSSIATKLAGQIMKELLPALGIYPDGEIDYLLTSPEEEENNQDTSQAQTGQNANTQGTEGSPNTSAEANQEQTQNNGDPAASQTQEDADSTENSGSNEEHTDDPTSANNEADTTDNQEISDNIDDPSGSSDTAEQDQDLNADEAEAPSEEEYNMDALE